MEIARQYKTGGARTSMRFVVHAFANRHAHKFALLEVRTMSHPNTAVKVAGVSLAAASLLLIVSLVFHGPPSPDLAVQMKYVAEGAIRWAAVHWAAAVSLSLFAVGGLAVLAAGSRLTRDWPTMAAWIVLSIGAIWTKTTAVAEATVVTQAAAMGDQETFEAWWAFAEGMANGFACLGLATAVIAVNEALNFRRATPAWAAWIGAAAGTAAFLGWVMGSWIGLAIGGPVWLISSLVMCLWMCWFGAALALAGLDLGERKGSDAKSARAG